MKKMTQKLLLLTLTALCTSAFAQISPTGLWNRVGNTSVYNVYNDLDNDGAGPDLAGDGALKINGQTAVIGQGIVFNFNGTMQDGTTYTIDSALYNDTSTNYCRVIVSLWNTTDNVQLAAANGGAFYTLNAAGNVATLVNFSYTATASEQGKKLELRFIRADDGSTLRDFEIDYARLDSTNITDSFTSVSPAGKWSLIGSPTDAQILINYNDADNGDGVADGAVKVDGITATAGIGAAYTFNQTMVTGVTYVVDTSVYNTNGSFCNLSTWTLWNKTDNVQRALYISTGVNLTSAGGPIQLKYLTYTAVAGDNGKVLEVRFITNDANTSRDFWIDNITLNGAITSAKATTWDGTAWDLGTPTSTVDGVVSGNYTVPANIFCRALTVNNSANVTVPAGRNVTLAGVLTVSSGSFTLASNANLNQTSNVANTGNIIVNRDSNALSRLDYTMWSSPVTNASQFLTTFSPATDLARFYNYTNSTNAYASIASPSTTPFTNGSGYLIRMPNTAVTAPATETFAGQYTGVANNGNVPVTLEYIDAAHPYNAVGNPYPSAINADTFLTTNNVTNSYIGGTLYFWRKTSGAGGSAYASYTSLGGAGTAASGSSAVLPNGFIPVGQGFIVAANAAATVNLFTNAMRVANNSNIFFKTRQVAEKSRVWLNLTNEAGAFSQMLVGYMDGASKGVDATDGKYINDSATALTSNIEGGEYVIQGRPAFDASDVVALNFKAAAAGTFTITKDSADGVFATGQDVYFVDATNGTETNLQTDAYTFSAPAGTSNARFSLKYQKTLGINVNAFNDNGVAVYRNNGTINVSSGANEISSIKVYDILGRVIAEQNNVNANSATINNLRATNQVLLVKVTGADNTVVTKKVVN